VVNHARNPGKKGRWRPDDRAENYPGMARWREYPGTDPASARPARTATWSHRVSNQQRDTTQLDCRTAQMFVSYHLQCQGQTISAPIVSPSGGHGQRYPQTQNPCRQIFPWISVEGPPWISA